MPIIILTRSSGRLTLHVLIHVSTPHEITDCRGRIRASACTAEPYQKPFPRATRESVSPGIISHCGCIDQDSADLSSCRARPALSTSRELSSESVQLAKVERPQSSSDVGLHQLQDLGATASLGACSPGAGRLGVAPRDNTRAATRSEASVRRAATADGGDGRSWWVGPTFTPAVAARRPHAPRHRTHTRVPKVASFVLLAALEQV